MNNGQLGLDIDIARAEGEAAMNAAAARANRLQPGWSDAALLFVAQWLRTRHATERFTAEAFVDAYIETPGLARPPDDRAFGVVVRRALTMGLIAYADSKGRRRKGHGSRCDRYRSRVCGLPWTVVAERLER